VPRWQLFKRFFLRLFLRLWKQASFFRVQRSAQAGTPHFRATLAGSFDDNRYQITGTRELYADEVKEDLSPKMRRLCSEAHRQKNL
jgi:hypothetical protein